MELPKRKSPRIPGYDYSTNGAYEKKQLFGSIGADSISARMVERTFLETIQKYDNVKSHVYVVMPNHFHAIIQIERADMESAPTISQIIQSFKRYSTVEYIKLVNENKLPRFDGKVWQRSFHDHVVRGEKDYLEIWNYIEGNPSKWEEDCFYVKE